MSRSRQWAFSAKQDRGKDFLRYLKTENMQINGTTKSQLKSLYTNQYKEYVLQIRPDTLLINFSSVLFTLFKTNVLHLQDNMVYLGPPDHVAVITGKKHASNSDELRDLTDRANPTLSINNHNAQSAETQILSLTSGSGHWPSFFATATPDDIPSLRRPRSRGRHKRVQNWHSSFAVDQHLARNTKTDQSEHGIQLGDPVDLDVPDGAKKDGNLYKCVTCHATCHSKEEYNQHVTGKRHRLQKITSALKTRRSELTKNKEGVTLRASVEGVTMETETISLQLEEDMPKSVTITIHNNSLNEELKFCHCEMLKRVRAFYMNDPKKVTDGMKHVNILPGDWYTVTVEAKVRHAGTFHTPIAFQFSRPSKPDKPIHIIRFLSAKCSNAITEELGPVSDYRKPPRMTGRSQPAEIVDGVKPSKFGSDSLERVHPLELFTVHDNIRKLTNRGFAESNVKGLKQAEVVELQSLRSMLLKQFGKFEEYEKRFSLLLDFEETQMEVDIRRYDMEDVTMKQYANNRKCLLLEVPGLAENRPSVLKGDWLFVRIRSDGTLSKKEYKGYVHEVLQNAVALGFHQSLLNQFVPNMKFNVRFTFNRTPVRLQHRAVKLACELSMDELLFPTTLTACSKGTIISPTEPLKVYNQKIKENKMQMQAIQNIVAGTSRPAPYIIFGPPGTGKTVTIVEAMKQIIHCVPSAHILACTPSNSAADLITERLLEHLSKTQVFRLMAYSHPWSSIKPAVKDVCNYDRLAGQYFYPPKAQLQRYKIVVCTLVTAGRLASANFPPEHFTHVFIDEAGYAIEPECMIAVAGILDCLPEVNDGGQLVLAGDPKQLGAILRSPLAVKYDLGMSLLERYMTKCDVYAKTTNSRGVPAYNPKVLTKLVQNYRSHPSILEKPNIMFYEGELQACADQMVVESLCGWDELPCEGFPIIFHGVAGEDMREERSPSFFNPAEVYVVIKYIRQLLAGKFPGMKLGQAHIGVISPYRKQVQKIQKLAKQNNWKDIKVGSVEEFQGQERHVIIVSTVRSRPEHLPVDQQFHLGFLNNPKRFNVAITRAKALLIIVGNPDILNGDEHWRSFLEFCRKHEGYTGVDYQPLEDDIEDMLQRFTAVSLDRLDEEPVNIEKASELNEQPWRGEL